MSHASKHPRRDPEHHHRRHHRHSAAKQGAAGAAFGAAAAAGAVPLGDRLFGQGKTAEMAEHMVGKLPKDMVTGLALGFAADGLAGAWVTRSGQESHAERIAQEHENTPSASVKSGFAR